MLKSRIAWLWRPSTLVWIGVVPLAVACAAIAIVNLSLYDAAPGFAELAFYVAVIGTTIGLPVSGVLVLSGVIWWAIRARRWIGLAAAGLLVFGYIVLYLYVGTVVFAPIDLGGTVDIEQSCRTEEQRATAFCLEFGK